MKLKNFEHGIFCSPLQQPSFDGLRSKMYLREKHETRNDSSLKDIKTP